MANIPADSPDIILGQEFLTWLWYKSDVAPGAFLDKSSSPFSVSMEQHIVVQGGDGDARETASVSGTLSPLREARFGLATGKKVTKACIHLEKEEFSYQFTLKAEDFSLSGLRTPKIENTDSDEPDSVFFEKMYLLETCVGLFDSLYSQFIHLRLSSDWEKEVEQIQKWMAVTE